MVLSSDSGMGQHHIQGLERSSEDHTKWKVFIDRGGQAKERVITTSFFGGWEGSIEGITTLLLTRKFQIDWFKITFLGEAEIAIR